MLRQVKASGGARAADLADAYPELAGRDLLHAALMDRLHIRHLVSAGTGFDRLPDLERLDSGRWTDWRHLVMP